MYVDTYTCIYIRMCKPVYASCNLSCTGLQWFSNYRPQYKVEHFLCTSRMYFYRMAITSVSVTYLSKIYYRYLILGP